MLDNVEMARLSPGRECVRVGFSFPESRNGSAEEGTFGKTHTRNPEQNCEVRWWKFIMASYAADGCSERMATFCENFAFLYESHCERTRERGGAMQSLYIPVHTSHSLLIVDVTMSV